MNSPRGRRPIRRRFRLASSRWCACWAAISFTENSSLGTATNRRRSSRSPPLSAEESSLTGAYMTGTEPGHHGIVILASGRLELFQVNARGGPGTVYGTYRLGRKDGQLVLSLDQPGGLIKVNGREALEYCGETYRRILGR
jgi:hypothetical protein